MTPNPDICRICEAAIHSGREDSLTVRAICNRCGTYQWRFSSDFAGYQLRPEDKAKLAGYVRTQNSVGITPFLDKDGVDRIVYSPLPRLRERADLAIRYLVNENTEQRLRNTHGGAGIPIQDNAEFQAVTYSKDVEATRHVLEVLRDDDLVHWDGVTCRLKAKGRLKGEDLLVARGQGVQGFVAMSFVAELNEAYTNGFLLALKPPAIGQCELTKKSTIVG